ncbi:MAG TPA: hypothetical protein VNJ53_07625, partial [Gaiellaceae bacterium]|nr:hypothetical protein [Gaiellaceae bacterium]
MQPPEWSVRLVRALVLAVAAAFGAAALFAALVMPYRAWDSLAFGAWSRSIGEGNGLWEHADALKLQRPLFYVAQGLAWRVSDAEWIGRLVSLAFAVLLAAAVVWLARRLAPDADVRRLLAPLALAALLGSSELATHAASGMTDVPVAALVAATA